MLYLAILFIKLFFGEFGNFIIGLLLLPHEFIILTAKNLRSGAAFLLVLSLFLVMHDGRKMSKDVRHGLKLCLATLII